MRSSTNLLHTPESITACIFSLGPSERYDRAQHESASTSLSVWYNNLANTGSDGDTWNKQIFGVNFHVACLKLLQKVT